MAENFESILETMKKMLGPTIEQYEIFDADLIVHINTVFMVLHQLGVGPTEAPFYISTGKETWSDFMPGSAADMAAVKSYMYFKLKLMFDPPSSAFVLTSIEKQIAELEWRMLVRSETP